MGVSEPGGRYTPDPTADFHVVIGDESALPAAATVLDALPAGVPVLTVLEVADAAEEQVLSRPVTWVYRGPHAAGAPLSEAVRSAAFPAGRGQVWLSGESSCVRNLRRYLLDERGLDRRAVHATAYWRAR